MVGLNDLNNMRKVLHHTLTLKHISQVTLTTGGEA